jgi:serine/threonine-protein kinase HipA
MTEAVQVLDIRLHDTRVGYLAGDRGGRNAFTFAPEYVAMGPARPTLGLAFNRLLAEGPPPPQRSRHRLPSWFSNLLPEGALRDLVASRLKVHSDNEFPILAALGADLPRYQARKFRTSPCKGLIVRRWRIHRPSRRRVKDFPWPACR